jgi:hypothetical protein
MPGGFQRAVPACNGRLHSEMRVRSRSIWAEAQGFRSQKCVRAQQPPQLLCSRFGHLMLLGEVVCDGAWRIAKREFAGTADNNQLWLVYEMIMYCKMFSDIFGTVVHLRHRSNNRRLHQQQCDEGKDLKNRLILWTERHKGLDRGARRVDHVTKGRRLWCS